MAAKKNPQPPAKTTKTGNAPPAATDPVSDGLPDAPPAATDPVSDGVTNAPPVPQTVPGIRVTAKCAGFWRAGRHWGAQPVEVPLSELSDVQVGLLLADVMLSVTPIDIPVAE